jgi:hypothetical protein
MDEQEKPFDTVSIAILMIVAIANDIAEIIADLIAIPLAGVDEIIMEPIDFLIDAIVTTWFFMKCGLGAPALAQVLDDVLESIGVPGRTICVGFGIYLANHPKSALGKIGQAVATVESGGESGAMEGLQEGETVAKEAESTAATAAKAEKNTVAGAEEKPPSEKSKGEEESRKEKEEEEEKKMEPEEEREPEEVEKEKILEQTPQEPERQEESEESEKEEMEPPRPSNVISMDDIRRNPRAEEVKRNLDHPNAPRDITTDNGAESDPLGKNESIEEAA